MRFAIAAAAALIASGVPAHAQGLAADPVVGTWLNPHRSVAVRTGECGDRLCGWVVWASGQAAADAREGGVQRLVGTKLLEDYARRDDGSWAGTVYVPDMGHRFASTITQSRTDRLVVRGCLIGGLFCKSQVWSRAAQVPHE